ncbi:MAG: hypothetical protein ABI577_15020 [bacterium]
MDSSVPLRSYQIETVFSLVLNLKEHRGETFTVMFSRQAGKNEVSAALVASLLVSHRDTGGSIIVCAPTLRPQASISLERTHRRARELAASLGITVTREGPTLRCGAAAATFLSASPAANVAGHTASLLLVGDEAQDIDADWFDHQFRPMTSTTGAPVVLFGTPWEGDSLLEKAVARNRERDAKLPPMDPRERRLRSFHHEYPWSEVARHLPAYGLFIEKERERLGPNHPIFLSQYELVAAAAEHRLLGARDLAAIEGDFDLLVLPRPGERYVAGLDFGGESQRADATVLTIARLAGERIEVVAMHSWQGESLEEVFAELAALARRWNFERLACDATGIGLPIVARLRSELGRMVHGITFSRSEKSALGFGLQAEALSGRLFIAPPGEPGTPGIQALWDELRACRAEPVGRGELDWRAPSGMHDDCVASLALCIRAARESGGPRKAVGRSRS